MHDERTVRDASRKARSSFLWLASSSGAWQAISWAFTILIVRILTPGDYGLFALGNTLVPYLTILATLKLDAWIIQEESFDPHKQRSALTLLLGLGGAAALLALLVAPHVAGFYEEPRLIPVYRVLALGIAARAMRILPEALLRRDLRFKPIAIINVAVGAGRNVLQLALALMGHGYWALVLGLVFADVAGLLALSVVVRPVWGLAWDFRLFASALRFGAYAAGATVLWTLGTTIDDIAIGKFLGKEILGYYAMAYFLSELPLSKLNQVLSPVLLSYYSRIKSVPSELYRIFLQVVQGIGGLVGPALVGLALVSPELFQILFGDKWSASVPMFQLLCVVWLVGTFGGNTSPLFYALGKPEKLFRFNLVHCLLVVPSFLILTPIYGMTGVYVTWLFVYPLSFVYLVTLLKRSTDIGYGRFVRNFLPPLTGVLVMGAAVFLAGRLLLADLAIWLRLVAKIALGLAVYAATMWFVFPGQSRRTIQTLRAFREDHRRSETAT